jgi:polysaccharide deacetylase family protein (PEP-CTERM system associated)
VVLAPGVGYEACAAPTAPPGAAPVPGALTIDVEEYFQVENLRVVAPRASWDERPRRLPQVMPALLDLLERTGTRATFFVLGWVAERLPDVVRAIAARGHEIGCHGYSHDRITDQSEEVFRDETRRARVLLQDLTGRDVTAYRAATFSVTRKTLWALQALAECGFTMDSSVVPVRHDRYGIHDTPQGPYRWRLRDGLSLLEVPVSTARVAGHNLPVGGGGYFRLYPLWLSRAALRRNARRGLPPHLYFHPWEFDPDQPRMSASLVRRFRHYVGIARTASKLEALLREMPMGTLGDLGRHYQGR